MDKSIESNTKFKIKYTKQDGETVRRFGILTDEEIEAVAYYVFNSTNK